MLARTAIRPLRAAFIAYLKSNGRFDEAAEISNNRDAQENPGFSGFSPFDLRQANASLTEPN